MSYPTPQDPIIRDIVNLIRGQQVSRRGLMQGVAAAGAGAGVLGLSACSNGGGGGDKLVWANWTLYLDFDDETQTYPSLEAFMDETGLTVDYLEEIDDNNTFYAKIKDQLELGKHTGFDVITLTDWMNARLIVAEQVQEFDYANLPNVKANLLDSQWDALDVDPGRRFSIPWQLPASGWVWNTEAVPGGIRELDDFLKPELHGKVGVLSEMRDTIGMILSAQGVDPASDWGDTEFDTAIAWLDDALQSGQIANVKGNSYVQDLETGATVAAMAWTGDIVQLNAEQGEQWTLEVPESGGMITADSFTVPNGTSAEAKANVEKLIDYYYDPIVAAMVSDYVTYVPAVKGTQEEMEKINPENASNPLIFPDSEMESRLHNFRSLTAEEDQRYTTAFQSVLGL